MKPSPLVISILSKLSGVIPTWKIIPGQDIIETAFKQPEIRKQVRENPYCYKGRPRLKTAYELLRVSTDLEKRLNETLSLTVLLDREHDHHDTLDDAISFFGVHRTASHASQIAVIGGTGKFEHAKGYAIVETLHNQNNQHITDGQDTILHFSVYLTYKA
ncbi:hypothetical protein F2Q69_00001952 [Brassica cretica]|uniref:Dirigent protein n=1 Tax=Brassica cretica TaxID=69181 RepID=A0A8S9P907_BRACR|nr:hypothetical protein F2Q69_00001952 [Brassica cretica]